MQTRSVFWVVITVVIVFCVTLVVAFVAVFISPRSRAISRIVRQWSEDFERQMLEHHDDVNDHGHRNSGG